MKKFIFIISSILLFSTVIFAQTDAEKPVEWKLFSPAGEEFSVDAPDNLNFSVFYNTDENVTRDKTENRRYSGKVDGTYFFIFSDILAYAPQFETALKFVEIYQQAEADKQKNSKAMKFSFSDDENFFHTIYAVKTKSRSYIFHLVSEKQDDPNVKKFFASLNINKKPAIKSDKKIVEAKSKNAVQKPVEIPVKNKQNEQSVTNAGIGKAQGSGNGNGTGQGQGSGFGTGIGSLPDNQKIYDTKALSITYKPKPKYTDFARFYEITGNVRVKTTFLDNGLIGTTTPITRLPFGLTKAAVEAAMKMRFEPQSKDGKPLSVVKVVVFNFTIY